MSVSAGILVYRRHDRLEVLLAHPGGPFWARRDFGAWSIPKGELDDDEPLAAARREFAEETGAELPDREFTPLGSVTQKSGKVVHAWAIEGDYDVEALRSNLFEMEWPPGSGRLAQFPEVDRFEWFGVDDARVKVNPAQIKLIDRLVELL